MKRRFNLNFLIASVLFATSLCSCSDNSGIKTGTEEEPQTYLFSNNYHAYVSIPQLNIERSYVYFPGDEDWHYSHHPSLAYFKGKFIAIFSNGIHGEDEGSQRVLFSTSTDGMSWTECRVLKDITPEYVLTPGGLLVANDDLLVAYYTRNDLGVGTSRPNPRLFAMHTSDGENWEGPVDLGLATFPSHRPSKLSSGRLLLTGNRNFHYTDDPTGLSGWIRSQDSNFRPGETASLVEGAIIEQGDSVYTLFRDTKGRNYLWQESSLNGEKWGVPTRIKFSNDNTKLHLGKLPDGKSYYVGTPDTLNMGKRTPLVFSTSEDGFKFGKHYIIAKDKYVMRYTEGRWKSGEFGYPYSIVHDGYLYIIISRQKEAIEVIRFALSQLEN